MTEPRRPGEDRLHGLLLLVARPVPASEALLRELRAVVGRDDLLHDHVDLQTYEYDAWGEPSLPSAVVFVSSTADVAKIVKIPEPRESPVRTRGYGTKRERRVG